MERGKGDGKAYLLKEESLHTGRTLSITGADSLAGPQGPFLSSSPLFSFLNSALTIELVCTIQKTVRGEKQKDHDLRMIPIDGRSVSSNNKENPITKCSVWQKQQNPVIPAREAIFSLYWWRRKTTPAVKQKTENRERERQYCVKGGRVIYATSRCDVHTHKDIPNKSVSTAQKQSSGEKEGATLFTGGRQKCDLEDPISHLSGEMRTSDLGYAQ